MIFQCSKRQFNLNSVWFLHVFMALQLSQKPKKRITAWLCVCLQFERITRRKWPKFRFRLLFVFITICVTIFLQHLKFAVYKTSEHKIWVLHNLRSKHIACNKQIYSLPLELSKLSKMINGTNCLLYIYAPSFLGRSTIREDGSSVNEKMARKKKREGGKESEM